MKNAYHILLQLTIQLPFEQEEGDIATEVLSRAQSFHDILKYRSRNQSAINILMIEKA